MTGMKWTRKTLLNWMAVMILIILTGWLIFLKTLT